MPRSGISSTIAGVMLVAATTSPAMTFAQLHTGDPGAAGTSNPSSVTTREAVAWPGSATSNAIAATTLPEWPDWAGTSPETETDITLWTASTSGTFDASMQLGSSVTMDTGDSLTMTEVQLSMTGAIAS